MFAPDARVLLAAVLLASAVTAHAADYKIDDTHSFVQFRTKHLGYSWLYGRFNINGGHFSYDPAKPESSKITVDIDVASIDSNHELRDEHLRNKYLFTDKQPKASFTSTAYQGDANSGTLTGELQLNGVKKPVTIPVKKIGEGSDPWGGYRVGFEGNLTIDARDYGYTYQLGEQSFIIDLQLGIEGVQSAPASNKH
ncbi:MAG: YceI family protein [Cellvibrionales bacterium]|jgi:polyisoprenoid-binding protein YceI|nr:YceI family protein [Cellvibrionales bacterium]